MSEAAAMLRASQWAVAVGVLVLLVVVTADDACSGHGTLSDTGCLCSNPIPTADVSGWVGDQCQQEVKLLPSNGLDLTSTLSSGQTICFFTGSQATLNYFVVSATLADDSQAGLQLFGLLGTDINAVTQAESYPVVYPRQPPGQGSWDYLVQVTPGDRKHAQLQLEKAAALAVQHQGIYLCASGADGPPASFTLRAAGHTCPLTLHDNGFISICSSTPEDVRYSGDTCPAGLCACTAKYSKPPAPVDAGLGFETCSSSVEALPDAGGPDPVSVTITSQQPDTWVYFNMTLDDTHKHLALTATATQATAGRISVFLRPHQPPGRLPGQYVGRNDYADFSGDLSLTVQLGADVSDVALSPGVWYVGIYTWDDEPVSYSLSVRRSACPGVAADCSGRGSCDAGTGTCTCNVDGATGADCATSLVPLSLGTPVTVPPRVFAADSLSMTGLTDALSVPTVSLSIKASFKTQDPLPAWVTARPLLLLSGHSSDQHLTPDTAPIKLLLPAPDTEYSIQLDADQVPEGNLSLTLWNTLSSPYLVGYTVSAQLQATCLDGCNDHGTCGQDGRCTCQDGWAGASCTVDVASLSNSTRCDPGSRKPVRQEEKRATCWLACDADTGTYDESHCVDFSCDPTASDGTPQRRAGGQELCVTDLCGPAGTNLTFTDASGQFVCERPCVCPADGGQCALDACLPGTQHCLDGLIPVTTTEGAIQCESPAAPGVCEEGALKPAIPLEGGAAYAVCVCSPPPQARLRQALMTSSSSRGSGVALADGQQCAWTSPSSADAQAGGGLLPAAQGVVVCGGGWQLVGAEEGGMTLSDGRKITSGGRCIRIQTKRGVSGGMVFFWCLFSVALAATLVVAGRQTLEWYEARRWDLGDEGDDMRVGLLGYVKMGLEGLTSRRGGGSATHNAW